jgi:hypothetical protein
MQIMGRVARILVPDFPHHVIQRGNHRQQTSKARTKGWQANSISMMSAEDENKIDLRQEGRT